MTLSHPQPGSCAVPRKKITTTWHWFVDRLLNWALLIIVALILLGLCVAAFAKPRAVTDERIEPLADMQSIRMPVPGAERIDASPSEFAPMHVNLRPPSIQVDQPVPQEINTALDRLLAQANAKPSHDAALAAWQLGLIYLHGAGVAVDRTQAQRWFEQASKPGGVPLASAGLAWCAISGCVGPPEPEQAAAAIAALKPAAPARADFLRWLLDRQTAPISVAQPGKTNPSNPRSDERLLAAARNGDAQARIELGIRAATRQNFDEAIRWFSLAANQSRAATINLERVELLANQKQATDINPVSSGGASIAAFEKAQRYHRGLGGPANYSEAIRLYRQSAQQGYLPAKAMLELIFSRPGLNGTLNVAWMQQLAYVDTRQKLPQFAPATQPQLVRDPSPLFDLMDPFWQRQVQTTGI